MNWSPDSELTLMQRAALGDLDAQRAMVRESIDGKCLGLVQCFEWAEFWARLAASRGEVHDKGALLSVLGLRIDELAAKGDDRLAASFLAESIAMIDELADGGDEAAEIAAVHLVAGADAATPEIFAMAQRFKEMWA